MARLVQTLGVHCRMSSTASSLIHPDKIFTNAPPLPQPWTKSILPLLTPCPVTLSWKESKGSHCGPLGSLQTALHTIHKCKVKWPVDESALANLTPGEYLKALLQLTANLFSQLHLLKTVKKLVECLSIDLGEFIHSVTFSVETDSDCWEWQGAPPIVLALVTTNAKDFFHANGEISSPIEYVLSKAFNYNPSVTSIIVTNFSQITIFSLPTWKCPEPIYDRILTYKPSLALRVLATAYLYDMAPHYSIILLPPPIIEPDETLIFPEGPTKDPGELLLPDEELFMTHHRHSDFDLATLIRDCNRAHQFFRWKEYIVVY
ncbi:hypothetical protein Clacol_000889 [Clathrus columnatus]|uniref:Uncharacterized protein n=1 Tax=Clathrus columnatus TaxID=1419009 RepID=A0AAV5A098_9AGAM|nr:hypothetical protein Clacol_000889 [Clathrus columnatus]